MGELNYMGCAGLVGVAAELALGVLTGRERAEALAHLDRCEACRENVRQLTMADEELLELLPVSEPPPGFETRVLERLGHSTPGRGTTSRLGRVSHLCRRPDSQRGKSGLNRRTLAIAAAAMVAAGAGLGGWGMRSAMSSAPQVPLSSAALVSPSHRTVGEIFAYGGSSEWLYMSVDMDSWNGAVVCKLVGKDGLVTTVGSFRLIGGYGSWGSPDSVDNGSLSGARLVAPDGTLLATASFHTRALELRLSPPGMPSRVRCARI